MSTNKTTNYDLHAWEPGDDFLRSEFNENFSALDTKLHAVEAALPSVKKLKIATGSYQGTGSSVTQTISLGFRPRVVLVFTKQDGEYGYKTLCVDGVECNSVAMVDTGFTVAGTLNILPTYSSGSINGPALNPYTYLAFWWED